LPLPRELEHDYPDPGRAQRAEGHLVRHADAGPAERAGAVQRRPPQDAGLHGRRGAEGVVAAFDHVPEFDDAAPGATYSLTGKQLAGLDQGTAYGDDVQNATNFPVVRITNVATGVVTYARTSGWTSVSVRPGRSSSTRFTLPRGTPAGKSTLVVIA